MDNKDFILSSSAEERLKRLGLFQYSQRIQELTVRIMRFLNSDWLDSRGVIEGNMEMFASEIASTMKTSHDFNQAIKTVENKYIN